MTRRYFIEDGRAIADHARVQRARLQADNIKWLVGKYAPRTYGDKPVEDDQAKNLTITWQKMSASLSIRGRRSCRRRRLHRSPTTRPVACTHRSRDPRSHCEHAQDRVPKADQRSPDAVLDEVMGVIDAR